MASFNRIYTRSSWSILLKNVISYERLYFPSIIQKPPKTVRCYRARRADIPELHPPEDSKYHSIYNCTEKGVIYSKKPFKYRCEVGKYYMWCGCGRSHNQPFCDGTHALPHMKIHLRPYKFTPQVTKEYWFCNCKQTKNPPFCDGTHKSEQVQEANSVVKY